MKYQVLFSMKKYMSYAAVVIGALSLKAPDCINITSALFFKHINIFGQFLVTFRIQIPWNPGFVIQGKKLKRYGKADLKPNLAKILETCEENQEI